MAEALSFPLADIFPLLGCAPVEGVAKRVMTDTRQLQAGDLFVALRGERFDAHDFLPDAALAGAVAAVVERPATGLSLPQCQVEDTRLAYGEIATWHRQRIPLDALIGITGSNGKTSTKGMLASILQQGAPTLATEGNLNNEIGVPHTLLQLTPEHQYAVVEMGANHVGEIARIAAWAQPTMGIITQAAEAHVGEFGSLERIIEAKGELIDALPEGAPVVLNSGSAGFAQWQRRASQRGLEILTFGTEPADAVRITAVQQGDAGVDVSLVDLQGVQRHFTLPLWGLHQAWNSAAAIAAAQRLGVPWAEIETGLRAFRGAAGRMQPIPLAGGSLLIDDSYNANPASVQAAVETLQGEQPLIVCLGPLAELGEQEVPLMQALGQSLKQKQVSALWGLDLPLYPAVEAFGEGGQLFMEPEAMARALVHRVRKAPARILIKGSRSARMEQIIEKMRQMDADLFI